MSEYKTSLIDADGTHVFPISSLAAQNGNFYEGATGHIKWNPRDGLTFQFTIPSPSDLAGAPRIHGATPLTQGAGFYEIPTEPAWAGTLAGGKTFRLFATKGTSRNEISFGNDAKRQTVLTGQAIYGDVVLPKEGPLSFSRATPSKLRYFISGFQPFPWLDTYEATFDDGNSIISIGCLKLQSNPLLNVIQADNDCGVPNGAWLVDGGEVPSDIRTAPVICDEARCFISFLVGRSVPFLWTDRFSEDGYLTRLYYGAPHGFSSVLGNEQPIPLCQLRDVIKHSHIISAKLPAMFEKFRSVAQDYDIDFISSPIWSAFDTYADDKLTFACVSLERLATAHEEFQKRHPGLTPKSEEFLTPQQGAAIRPVLGAVVKALADVLTLSSEAVRILVEKKINNIHTAPNADKLIEVFTSLGLELSSEEKKTIDHRNRTLHGRRTMKERSLEAVAEETRRFDILRTLINKALLRLLEYDGPYMDWGAPEAPNGFSVGTLDKRPDADRPACGISQPEAKLVTDF